MPRTFINESSFYEDILFFIKDIGPYLLIMLGIVILFICGITAGLNRQEANPIQYKQIDGHEYVIYHYGFRGGITHSPNCSCITNKFNHLIME